MIPVGPIINISAKIAEYFGLIEGVSTQVKKLVHQAYKSAIDNLTYAKTASGQNQIDYIKEAKNCFINAVAVEENENKISALVGLSMCQFILGDITNAQLSLQRINDVELTKAELTAAGAKDSLKYNFGGLGLLIRILEKEGRLSPSLEDRINKFMNYRLSAINTTNSIIEL